jgi:predicted nuclease of predicted toxin-antitoxin system
MSRFLIDEDVNQKAVRSVPTQSKGFDVLFPEQGGYKGADDKAVRDIAAADQRVLVSVERDFGQFRLQPEDMPDGAIWIRPKRISQQRVGKLLMGLCGVLVTQFPDNPYDFGGKIVEVYEDRVDIRTVGDCKNSYPVPRAANPD